MASAATGREAEGANALPGARGTQRLWPATTGPACPPAPPPRPGRHQDRRQRAARCDPPPAAAALTSVSRRPHTPRGCHSTAQHSYATVTPQRRHSYATARRRLRRSRSAAPWILPARALTGPARLRKRRLKARLRKRRFHTPTTPSGARAQVAAAVARRRLPGRKHAGALNCRAKGRGWRRRSAASPQGVEGEAAEGAILVVLFRERRGAGFGAEAVPVPCPVGGWREGERLASPGAADNQGRAGRAVNGFSAAEPSRNRCVAVPRAAASPCRLAVHRPSPPSPRSLPSGLSRSRGEAGLLRAVGSQAASGELERVWRGRPPPHPVPLPPRSPSCRPRHRAPARSPRPGLCCRVRAGAGRRLSGAAGGGTPDRRSATRRRPPAEAARVPGPAAELTRIFLQRCENSLATA